MKKNKTFLHLLLIFLFVFPLELISCQKKTTETIVFDNTHPLALAPDIEWAVVTEPYAVFREKDEWEAATAGHCRKGEILQVNGKSVDAKKETWYYFDGGWLPQSCVSIFSNRYKAETVSKNLVNEK